MRGGQVLVKSHLSAVYRIAGGKYERGDTQIALDTSL